MNIRLLPRPLALAALFSAGQLFAQVDFISVEKLTDYIQTGTGTVTLRPTQLSPGNVPPLVAAPYQFRIDVEGTNIGGIGTPAFTVQSGSSYTGTLNLGYNSSADEWRNIYLFGQKANASGGPNGTPGGLDGIFNNGAYTVTIPSIGTVNLTLGGAANADLYPANPVATLSGGTWAGGNDPRIIVDPTQALTLTTSTFSNYLTNGYLNHIALYVSSNGTSVVDTKTFSDNTLPFTSGASTADSISHTFLANSLTPGQTYFVEIEFNTVASISNEINDVVAVALFTSRTQFSISAIPEPSTYAALAGLLALGFAVMRRRRSVAV